MEQHIRCPITKLIFNKPVLAKDQCTYEEQAIKEWIINNKHSPAGIWIPKIFILNTEMIECVKNYLIDNPSKKGEQYQLSNEHRHNKQEINTIIKSQSYDLLLQYTAFDFIKWLDNNTFLHILKLAPKNIIKYLIENCNFEPETRPVNKYKLQLINLVIMYSTSEIIKFIIDNKFDVMHDSIFEKLSEKKMDDIFIYLIDTQINLKLVNYIIKKCNRIVIIHTIKKKLFLEHPDKNGKETIHHLLKHHFSDSELITLLIDAGVNLECFDNKKRRPIHYAIRYSKPEVIKYVIQKGVKLTCKDNKGLQPIHYAIKYSATEVIDHIIQKGIKLTCKDNEGLQPIHYSIIYARSKIFKHIFEHTDPYVVDNNNMTLIHHVVKQYCNNVKSNKKYWSILKFLVNKKINLECIDNNGYAPIHYLIRCARLDIIKLLVHANANLECETTESTQNCDKFLEHELIKKSIRRYYKTNKNFNFKMGGWRPIHFAIYYNRLDVARYFITLNIDLECVTNNMMKPIDFAINNITRKNNTHYEFIRYLIVDLNVNVSHINIDTNHHKLELLSGPHCLTEIIWEKQDKSINCIIL